MGIQALCFLPEAEGDEEPREEDVPEADHVVAVPHVELLGHLQDHRQARPVVRALGNLHHIHTRVLSTRSPAGVMQGFTVCDSGRKPTVIMTLFLNIKGEMNTQNMS